MSTPAQIRTERKITLRKVKKELRTCDSLTDKLERLINRILKVKKRLPDTDDAQEILTNIREIDKQLDKVVSRANDFSQLVRTT